MLKIIMTAEELKMKFDELYMYMATSKNPQNMMIFGEEMKDMFDWFVANKPDKAKDIVDSLCAIKWKQYLTEKEAVAIVAEMMPKPIWSAQALKTEIEKLGYELEEEPYYNWWALYVAISMLYSDYGKTLAKVVGAPLEEIPAPKLVEYLYDMAMDVLKDKDNKYHIRSYFSV